MNILKVILAALLGAQAGAASAAEDLAIEVERTGERFSVRARATLAAPAELAWQVLTDYENLPRFIPGLSHSAVQLRGANRVLLEQKGEARFLVFSFPIEVRLEVRESPHAWISSHAVAGNLKRMHGRYELQPDAAGVRLRYTGELEPDFELPALIGPYVLRTMVEEQFAAMVAEIERRGALAR
jgi:ribosome-associated toxin RatA of RatAB toxin-antitoxin module